MARLTSGFRGTARTVTSPARDYLNGHFEAVKAEIREQIAQVRADLGARAGAPDTGETGTADTEAWAAVQQLESNLLEALSHQAAAMGRLTGELEANRERVAELEDLVGRLTEVVGTAISEPLDDPAESSDPAQASGPSDAR